MPHREPSAFAILDLGTTRTTLLAIRIRDGILHYAGHSSAESRGTRKGLVVDLDAAAGTIREVVDATERLSGLAIERVFLSLSGAHVRGIASQAGISLTSRSREIALHDVRGVLQRAGAIPLPEDREIIHVLPQEYVLDNQAGIHSPIGMLATRLEAHVYVITVAAGAKENLVAATHKAGVEVEEVVFAPLAVADGCLRAEDREAGVALVDLGGGSTGIAAYQHGMPVHAAVIPVGGDHFTNDIAIGMNTPPAAAEKIKCGFGFAAANYVHDGNVIEVPSLGNRPPRMLPHRQLCECIEPRAQELIRLIQENLRQAGLLNSLAAGLVLCGGGARLAGFREMVEVMLRLPVRLAAPILIEGMPERLADPEYAFIVGATYYSHRRLRGNSNPNLWQRLAARWGW